MDLQFDKGDPNRPKGHALVYFRTQSELEKVYATYILVLPIEVDFSKYVPPFLASHLGNMPLNDLAAFALPPVPEEMASYRELTRLADIREDDLVFGGTMRSFELPEMMQAVNDLVHQYAQLWSDSSRTPLPSEIAEHQGASGVNEVIYGLLSERDKLVELSKLVGKLRFTVESSDTGIRPEIEQEITLLSRFLPENYYVPSIIQAALDSSSRGSRLAQLYMDRCYKLSDRDEAGVKALEDEIESIRSSQADEAAS